MMWLDCVSSYLVVRRRQMWFCHGTQPLVAFETNIDEQRMKLHNIKQVNKLMVFHKLKGRPWIGQSSFLMVPRWRRNKHHLVALSTSLETGSAVDRGQLRPPASHVAKPGDEPRKGVVGL